MLFAILVHMFSVFFMKAYRKPREFGWLSGMVLLVLAAVFGFSGYLLPMDELSYFATKVGLQIPVAIPFIGPTIANMLRGGADVTEFTVQRFFALHVVVLPALFIPLLALSSVAGAAHGNAVPPSEEAKPPAERKTCPSCPISCARTWPCGSSRSTCWRCWPRCFPGHWAKHYDALAPAPMGIHPEWYFMSPFEMLKLLGTLLPGEAGEIAGMLLFTLGIVLWILIPFLRQTDRTRPSRSHCALFRIAGGLRPAGDYGDWLLDDYGKTAC